MSTILAEYVFGDILARYVQPQGTKRCELLLLPASRLGQVKEARATIQGRPEIEGLPAKFKPIVADSANSLVQIKLMEDETGGGFSSGVTMVESGTMARLEFENQTARMHGDNVVVETTLRDLGARFRCIHRLSYASGDRGLRASTLFVNESDSTLSLELLTSFALNGLTPYVSGNATSHLTFTPVPLLVES